VRFNDFDGDRCGRSTINDFNGYRCGRSSVVQADRNMFAAAGATLLRPYGHWVALILMVPHGHWVALISMAIVYNYRRGLLTADF